MLSVVFLVAAAASASPDRSQSSFEAVVAGDEPRSGVLGARVGFTQTEGGGVEHSAASLSFAGRGDDLRAKGLASSHGEAAWSIGTGTRGFEGGLALGVAVGPRLPVSPDHGPFIRIGARGWLEGSGAFYDSLLELPRGELGWQYIHESTAVEVGGTYGAVLSGRFGIEDFDTRHLGSGSAAGLYGVVLLPMLRFAANVSRLPAKDGGAIEHALVHGCALRGLFALCVDARWLRGDLVMMGATHEATSLYGGITVGVVPPPVGKP